MSQNKFCLPNIWLLNILEEEPSKCPFELKRGEFGIYISYTPTYLHVTPSACVSLCSVVSSCMSCVDIHIHSLWAALHVSFHFPCAVHSAVHLSKPWSIYRDTVINNKHEPSLRHNCFPSLVMECFIIPKALGLPLVVDGTSLVPGRWFHGENVWRASLLLQLKICILMFNSILKSRSSF